MGEQYESSQHVKEGYTIRQHTAMAMRQFEKYFNNDAFEKYQPYGIAVDMFRIVLALHDIGKHLSFVYHGEETYEHTLNALTNTLGHLRYNADQIKVARCLVIGGDVIGGYLTGKKDLSDTVKNVQKLAHESLLPANIFLELLLIYYQSDASSYTEDAFYIDNNNNIRGISSIDSWFDFDAITNRQEHIFSSLHAKKIEMLTNAIFTESKDGLYVLTSGKALLSA